MTEIAFHFNVPDKMAYACRLLRKAVNAGASVQVVADAPTLSLLDVALWTFSPLDFIPHCSATAEGSTLTLSPVLLGGDTSQKDRDILLNMGFEVAKGYEGFERLIELVGNDEDDRQSARSRWKQYTSRGYTITRHDLATRPPAGDNA